MQETRVDLKPGVGRVGLDKRGPTSLQILSSSQAPLGSHFSLSQVPTRMRMGVPSH